ncbi:hypothetical protein OJAV_G00027650 [Oryzias javanicus]|uniref:Uncharacterized protein n=1 Tax=Oryzias javanicus TaxID=123683 RepID=A0A3S2MUW9_ORYJA|nr:hypothetical protein OJAV_G00027650 [Oryzias javanicus]
MFLIRGEMEPGCYSQEACRFFSFDTGSGHLKVERGFGAVHLSGTGGGTTPPPRSASLSIHHSFSRCVVTIHGSNGAAGQTRSNRGLLLGEGRSLHDGGRFPPRRSETWWAYDALGHCFFTEDGAESRRKHVPALSGFCWCGPGRCCRQTGRPMCRHDHGGGRSRRPGLILDHGCEDHAGQQLGQEPPLSLTGARSAQIHSLLAEPNCRSRIIDLFCSDKGSDHFSSELSDHLPVLIQNPSCSVQRTEPGSRGLAEGGGTCGWTTVSLLITGSADARQWRNVSR